MAKPLLQERYTYVEVWTGTLKSGFQYLTYFVDQMWHEKNGKTKLTYFLINIYKLDFLKKWFEAIFYAEVVRKYWFNCHK